MCTQQEINKHPEKDPKRVPKTIIFRARKTDCDSLADQLYGLVSTTTTTTTTTPLSLFITRTYACILITYVYTILLWCGWLTGVCRGQPARRQEPAVPGPGHGELQGRLV